jgi:hypothetical protein
MVNSVRSSIYLKTCTHSNVHEKAKIWTFGTAIHKTVEDHLQQVTKNVFIERKVEKEEFTSEE